MSIESPSGPNPPTRVVVNVDLADSEEITRRLDEEVGVSSVAEVRKQVEAFVLDAIGKAGSSREESWLRGTGDGAIVAFDSAAAAHHFAVALHETARAWSAASIP